MNLTPDYEWAGVVAPHAAAADAARDILIEGGNAIEAAVAAAAVTSVVLPQAGGAGGDGLWLIREAGVRGRTRMIDARGPVGEGAALRSFRDRDLDAIPPVGGAAIVTVPGAVAGWEAALDLSHALGGKRPVSRLLEAAIALAREGFAAPDPAIRPVPPAFGEDAGFASALLVEGKPPATGATRHAPAWAETLGYLSQSGLRDFYAGDVGREIARDIQAIGGIVSRDDLRRFEARWREPSALRCGPGLIEAPPSRAGLAFLCGVGLVERLGPARPGTAAHLHALIEGRKHAAAILRAAQDAGVDPVALLTPENLLAESRRIDAGRVAPGGREPPFFEDGVSIGVVDGQGLAVALVGSLGTAFGSGRLMPKTGLLMGNRGARFELDDENGLVLRRGRRAPMDALPLMLTGRKGGVTSLGTSSWPIALGIAAGLGAGVGLGEAIAAPRVWSVVSPDHGGAGVLAEDGFDPSALAALARTGHEIGALSSAQAGEAAGVSRAESGRVEAAADSRRGAQAAGF